jgi:hypothetical protein
VAATVPCAACKARARNITAAAAARAGPTVARVRRGPPPPRT